MAEATGISWCDATFNPWVGCEKVSPGCAHCYAEALVTGNGPRQLNRPGTWGPEGVRSRTSPSTWRNPVRWHRLAGEGKLPNGNENPDGHRPRVFCASLADVFEPRPELEPWRIELFRLIADTPALDWLLLTKRPEEARDWMREWYWQGERLFGTGDYHFRDDLGWGVLPNIWIGTSIENARFTWRADALREIPATVRFLSCEPLVGSLFQERDTRGNLPGTQISATEGSAQAVAESGPEAPRARGPLDLTSIDWVIVGGESGGPNARPMHPAWAREIRESVLACSRNNPFGARPALHMKQWGSWAPAEPEYGGEWRFGDGRARTWITPDGRLVPNGAPHVPASSAFMRYAGARPDSGGKYLDGYDWCEFPEASLTPA